MVQATPLPFTQYVPATQGDGLMHWDASDAPSDVVLVPGAQRAQVVEPSAIA